MVNAGDNEWFEKLGIDLRNDEEVRVEEPKVENEER